MRAEVVRGLEGVVSHATRLSGVDGAAGRLTIGGYDISELVGRVSFEEVAYLLWHGDLPDADQLGQMRAQMAVDRILPSELLQHLVGAVGSLEGMHALRAATALLSVDDPTVDDLDSEANARRAQRITARMPALVAQRFRLRQGLAPCEPPADLGFAAAYLYMLDGRRPDPARVAALDAYLVAVIDHGMNASTFTARVVASTASDMVSAITAAVGALKGPLHGGVPGPVLDMLRAIGSPEQVEPWVRAALGRGERIMGFGHRVYKVRDPRAAVLEDAAVRLAGATGEVDILGLTHELERVTVQVLGEEKPGRDLYANVELYAALILHAVGIQAELFTPTFAVGRTAGWTAHVLEQYADNRLIRPQSVYIGPEPRRVVPLGERGATTEVS